MRIACVLLAAGLGTRMGGGKLEKTVGGETLIARVAALAASLSFSERVAVVRPTDTAVCETVGRAGLRPVYNPDPARGIASSLVIGLAEAQKSDPDGVMFFVGDQPGLSEETVRSMMTLFESEPEAIVRPKAKTGQPGNPVLFPKTLFGELMALTGDTGGKTVIKNHPGLVRFVTCEEAELRDIDTPSDIVG